MTSNIPLSAQMASNAPWCDTLTDTCPVCNGSGYLFLAYNTLTHEEEEISEDEFYKLKDFNAYEHLEDEELQQRGERLLATRSIICTHCDGTGCIEDDNDYYDYYED